LRAAASGWANGRSVVIFMRLQVRHVGFANVGIDAGGVDLCGPQKQRDRPFAIWVGSGVPVSCIRYFHAVKARWRRCSVKSASVQKGR
jgi:hypothetical protein